MKMVKLGDNTIVNLDEVFAVQQVKVGEPQIQIVNRRGGWINVDMTLDEFDEQCRRQSTMVYPKEDS